MSKPGMSRDEMQELVDPSPTTVSLQQQLRDALTDVKKLKAQVGSDLALFDHIQGSIEPLKQYPRVPITRPKLTKKMMRPSLIITDAHCEEVVDAEQMEGMAAYDWAIFQHRIATTFEKAVELTELMRQTAHIEEIDVWLLGDWFMGAIHPDDCGWGSSMPLPCALPGAALALGDQLMRLAAHFKKVKVIGVVGNHGRTTRKPTQKMTADRNWDFSVYLIAQAYTQRATNVEWVIPRSRVHVIDMLGSKVALTHGDISRSTGTVPYFGIINSMRKQHQSRRRTGKDFDYAFMGHWHHEALLDGEIFICPALIGPSQYSQYEMHSRSLAQQMIIFWSEKHGPTNRWPINL